VEKGGVSIFILLLPGRFRPMLGHQAHSVHRVHAESCLQALDELRHARRIPPVLHEEIRGALPHLDERPAAQPQLAHRAWQFDSREPLLQQVRDPSGLHHRFGKAQAQPRRRRVAVQQPDLECLDAPPATCQESAQLVEQRRERAAQSPGVGDLGLEIAARRKPCWRHEGSTRVCRTTQCTIEIEQHAWLEATGQAVARQAQAVPHGAYAHRGE
jgi:hypothetical protein